MAERTYMGIPRERISWVPQIDADVCIGCGECLETCPNNVFVLNEDDNVMEVAHPQNCVVLCDKCAGFCPQDAITFPNKEQIKQRLIQLLEELSERKNRLRS